LTNRPHSRFEHVFAVVRIEGDLVKNGGENAVYVTRIFRRQEDAEQEVARLNELNQHKGCRYFWQLTRLVHSAY
jgi:hypothetical protein